MSGPSLEELDSEHVLDSRTAGTRFLRGSALRMAAFVAGLAAGLGSTPLVVHHLGTVGWGQYATVTALMFVVAALTEGGLGQLGVRELSVGSASARQHLMSDLLGLRIALTLTGALIAFAFSLLVGYSDVVVEGTAIAAAGLLLTNVAGTLSLPLLADLRLGWLALIDFLPQLVTALTMIALVLAGAGLLPFYAASGVAGASTVLTIFLVVRGSVPIGVSFSRARWRALLAQTLVYAAATATGAMYFRIALLGTSVLSSKTQTGYFGLAFRILELTTMVPWLIVSSAFPILARSAWNDRERLGYALQRMNEGGLILGGWFALCLIIGAPFAIHVLGLGSRSFAPSVPVLRILGAAIPATFMLATYSYALLSLQQYRRLLFANGAIIVLGIALCGALIPPFGAEGAALTSVILELVLTLSYSYALYREDPALRPSFAASARATLSLALAFLAGVLLLHHPVIGVLAGSAVLGVSLLVLRAVPEELIVLLRR